MSKTSSKPAKEVQLYVPIQRIRYHNMDHPLGGTIVEPEDDAAKDGLPFTHLNASEINLLVTKRVLVAKK